MVLKRILILEENTDHLELLTALLEDQFTPIDIHTVETIEDCLDFLEQTDYDIVITGYLIHSTPIIERLKDILLYSRGAPVIVISGSGDEAIAADVIKCGASEYLVKTKKTLEKLPLLISKYFKRGRSKTVPQKAKADNTQGQLLREMDRLMQKARTITVDIATKSPTKDTDSVDSLFSQIKRLRKLIQKP
jgi:DNA-binding NtrC family response regulator